MTIEDFQRSLKENDPLPHLTPALTALWWDARGNWDRAHSYAQEDRGLHGAWVHAYLHRKEGDHGNAAYWYNRAGKPFCQGALPEEWLGIAQELLGDNTVAETT